MKLGKIVRSSLVPDQFYFLSRWKELPSGGIEVIDAERSRWDVSAPRLALEKEAIRQTLRSLIVEAQKHDLPGVAAWLRDQEVGPPERWHIAHDTPDSEIEPHWEARPNV